MLRIVGFFALAFCIGSISHAQMEPPQRELDTKTIAGIEAALRQKCDDHFSTSVQELAKASCYLGLVLFKESNKEKEKATAECARLTRPNSRPALACRLGVQIADDVSHKRDTFSARMKLCREYYPLHSETDAFLQDSCWIGVTLAFDAKIGPLKKPRLSLCTQFSSERAFVGPCAVGLSLASQTLEPPAAKKHDEQSQICMRYFDHQRFHQGYRGCMNARALDLEWNRKASALSGSCASIASGPNDDIERAACVVGGSIWHNLDTAPGGTNPYFQHCGDRKVSWTARDYLACLTAAALLNFSSAPEARNACKAIFPSGSRRHRNSRRDECYRSVDQLAARGKPEVIAPAPQTAKTLPTLSPDKVDSEDPDLWPEAPDTPEEETEANEMPATDEGEKNALEAPASTGS